MDYVICDPTGNITALVTTPTPVEKQPEVAADIMKREPTVEQVGFVHFCEDRVELRMAGGEFCGNATMSAAALFGKSVNVNEIPVTVGKTGEDRYHCTVRMPRPVSVDEVEPDGYRMTLVTYEGISHLVSKVPIPDVETRIGIWCRELECAALGVMFLDGEQLKPLVYVAGADTLFWESSCASGTAAVGYVLGGHHSFSEPGGVLEVILSEDGHVYLTGNVTIR